MQHVTTVKQEKENHINLLKTHAVMQLGLYTGMHDIITGSDTSRVLPLLLHILAIRLSSHPAVNSCQNIIHYSGLQSTIIFKVSAQ